MSKPRRRDIQRAVALLTDGYEILRPVKGTSPALGTDSLMGKPATDGQMHRPFLMRREVFMAYRANGWVQKLKPYVAKGWQAWGITDAGREEARLRPKPTREDVTAALKAHRRVGPR
jgi:hypothetical protein